MAMRRSRSIPLLVCLAMVQGCASPTIDAPPSRAEAAGDASIPHPAALPLPLTNNAVAVAVRDGTPRIYSFFGMGPGKRHDDIGRGAYEYDRSRDAWTRLPDVPVTEGRLASVAATAGGGIHLFGGYTVAVDGKEVSTPDVLRFDPQSRRYRRLAPIPVPVDDSVALVHRDRRIYLVSGWHEDRNVALVQVYDSREDRWTRATDYPGTPVFGHAGAIRGDDLLICDGVRLDVVDGKRTFSASAECWRGRIAADDPTRIDWRRVPPHPGPPRYRMAAGPDTASGALLFLGGSENPYNFNGIGYDGQPSPASDRAQAYDLVRDAWHELAPLPQGSMDHRGLTTLDGTHYLVGGMRDAQTVSAGVIAYRPAPAAR